MSAYQLRHKKSFILHNIICPIKATTKIPQSSPKAYMVVRSQVSEEFAELWCSVLVTNLIRMKTNSKLITLSIFIIVYTK